MTIIICRVPGKSSGVPEEGVGDEWMCVCAARVLDDRGGLVGPAPALGANLACGL